MTTDFVSNYYRALAEDPRPYTLHERRIINILERSDPQAELVAEYLESNVRSNLHIPPDDVVDWSQKSFPGPKGSVDWNAILAFIQALLPIILEIIKMFGG